MDNIIVGIDFGTTNTVISYFENNKSHILTDGVFKTIPSKIGKMNDKIYCGNYIPINCDNIIHSFKINNNDPELYIIFFRHIYDLIFKKFNNSNIKAVITVPSNFNDNQRENIRRSFISVGINVIRIINEPSAAALAYGLNFSSNSEEKIMVIDTGGGTMDFTILQKDELFFEVINSEGLNNLGGNNFTQLIYDDIKRIINIEINETILWKQAQKIKEKLTYLDNYNIKIQNIEYNLTKNKFNNMASILIKNVEDTLRNIINNYPDINYIILVGGSSRLSILQETIKNITNKIPWVHPNLETVVAEGASLYGGIIENKFTLNNDVVLMDVLPLSLGVELVDGTYSIIIPKNTPLPIKMSQKYTTDSPTETTLKIKVYQGERKIANKNLLIGEFIFDKVSMGGIPIIEITFKVDLNSIISVTVIDRKSGVEKNIIIKDIPKIEQNEIEEIIKKANKLSDLDDSELIRNQNIYLIKCYIENGLANLQINDLISTETKEIIINKFKLIDETIETMTNLELIDIVTKLQTEYNILLKSTIEESVDKLEDIERVFLNDRKNELKHKIELLLIKNPDWEEYLKPVLEELSYNTTTIDYINDKINLLNELEKEDKDYKQEVNNLCLFIKTELESGSIIVSDIKNKQLTELINETLNLLSNDTNNVDWENQLYLLNKKCEDIYNN